MKSTNELSVAGHDISPRELSQTVFDTCHALLAVIGADEDDPHALSEGFEAAISDIARVSFETLSTQDGSYRVVDGELQLNEHVIARLLLFVLGDLRREIANGIDVSPDEVRSTLHDVISLFTLHELRHRTQGVELFSTVQRLKNVGNRLAMTRIDVLADRDAALALAAVRSCSLSGQDFLEYYQRALFYSVQYFFKVFPANEDRLDKCCRVASLMLMLARLQSYLTTGSLRDANPTDALHVEISPNYRTIAVYEMAPRDRLIAANDVEDLPAMIANIQNGRLDAALRNAYSVAAALDLY